MALTFARRVYCLPKAGLEGVTLRKLAKVMNMQAPSLYWYFKGKRSLIDFMAEEILQKEFTDFTIISEDQDWKEWLTGSIVTGAHLGPAKTLGQIITYSLESLHKGGVPSQDARTIVMTALHFTFGRVIEEQESPKTSEAEAEFRRSLAFIIR